MIEEQATVTAREGEYAWVEARKQSACGGCELKGGCGTSVLSKWLSPRMNRMRAINEIDARVGEDVVVGLQEGALLRGAFMVYLFPLMAMVVSAVLAHASLGAGHDGLVILAGALGLIVSSLILRRYHRRIQHDSRFQPVILRQAALVESTPVKIDTSSLKGF